eukprot:2222379-Alexandrium_andersonii.AAC.1
MLNSAKLEKLQFGRVEGEGSDAKQSTDPSRLCVTEKALRSACQNALVISTIMLQEEFHLLLTRVVVCCSEPVDAWHSQQNKELRSAEGSLRWLTGQLDGGLMQH